MSQTTLSNDTCFTLFQEPIDSYQLPERFTYPFFYEPHPLCLLAAAQLQHHLNTQTDWQHNFGIDGFVDGVNIGKMFGVLLVQKENGELGYLSAFSGKLAEKHSWTGFVPPLADYLIDDSFFRKGEAEIMEISKKIAELECAPDYLEMKREHEKETETASTEITKQKAQAKAAKKERNIKREKAKENLSTGQFESFNNELKEESIRYHFEGKDLAKEWKKKLESFQKLVDAFENEIDDLKKERKKKSADLQQQIFDQYQFLNQEGQVKGLTEIFKDTPLGVPPSGAGDCAAPKLLQYAFEHELKPLAMAEFWWGQSPKSEIRKHGYFYPACKGKCHPILSHMLEGIDMDESPLQNVSTTEKKLETIYEDDLLLVINKPTDFLSVPGRTNNDSVYRRMQKKYPEATGPLMVHRLDRATSGLMLIAKTKKTHKALQDQFLNRKIKKRYVALLEGTIDEDSGTIELPLRADLDDRPRQLVCHEHGKPAITNWEVIERISNRTRIHFFPLTGRTHQLRMHAAHSEGLNMPIVGDDLYGKPDARLHLHAECLEFDHPLNNEKMVFQVNAEF